MGAVVRQGQASQINESLFTKIRQISQLQKYIIGTSFSLIFSELEISQLLR